MNVRHIHRFTTQVRSSVLALLLAACMTGCGNDMDKIQFFDRQTLQDNTLKGVDVQRSENGHLQMLMQTPYVEQYSKPEAKTVYPQGVYMRFFDGYDHPTATLRARYAVSYDKRDYMMVRDSVVIIDLRSGDTTFLDELTWDATQHRIFSEKPLRSQNGPRVTYGDGFESDENMLSPQILHQRGTIEWKEE